MTQEQIEAVRRDISALRNGLLYPWQHDAAKDRILATIDHLTKANEELRAEVELAKQEGVAETLQQIDCLTGGDGEYRLSTCPDRNCPDEDAMRAKIVARFDGHRATIDRLAKERDGAWKSADRSQSELTDAIDDLDEACTRLSAMQEAIDEAVRRADEFRIRPVGSKTPEWLSEPLRPFATKPEPEVDPLVEALREIVDPLAYMKARAEQQGTQLSGMAYSIANDAEYLRGIARTALAARGLEVRKVGEASVPVTKATHTCKHEGDNCQRHNLHCAWPECAVVRNHTEGRTDG